jgi:hypothetical protein
MGNGKYGFYFGPRGQGSNFWQEAYYRQLIASTLALPRYSGPANYRERVTPEAAEKVVEYQTGGPDQLVSNYRHSGFSAVPSSFNEGLVKLWTAKSPPHLSTF